MKWLIVPTIGSGLHPSFGGQSSGSETHSHLESGDPSQNASGFREREMIVALLTVPLSPQSSWGRASLTSLKNVSTKEYINIRGLSISTLKGGAFRPLNPPFCK
ncbi:hypothetical protein [Sulfurisphaera ohwakuensis]|uniref:hypothetical protein n=1 Tax=Sulfurisphaera ohwakuensis TaxID=69656 RepID=UPI0036F317B9